MAARKVEWWAVMKGSEMGQPLAGVLADSMVVEMER